MAINSYDRKLRPIYEAWDCNNYKAALALCNKLLKKEDLVIYKALKAVSLFKCGKTDESLVLCGEVKDTLMGMKDPQDIIIPQALCMVWKPLGLYSEICSIWSIMVQIEPGNEEFLNHLFMGFVRCKNLKAMQEIALNLNRSFKDPKYLYWVVFINYLQFIEGGNLLNIQLAERILSKIDRFSGEELKLYIKVLTIQNKYLESIEVLKTHGSALKIESEREKILVDLLLKLGRKSEALVIIIRLITNDKDDYDTIEKFIELCGQDESEFCIRELKKLLSEERGPFLALAKMGELPIEEYFRKFGAKNCCFADVKPFLLKIDEKHRSSLIDNLCDYSKGNGKIEQIIRDLFITKVRYYFDFPISIEELSKKYRDSLDHNEKLEETQREYGDDYVIIMAQLFIRNNDFYSAIFILEEALSRSKYNYDFKIHLVRLYQRIGVFVRAAELYASLEVKNILHDTVSHYLVDFARNFGFSLETHRLLTSTMSIYSSNKVETPEMICQAYKYGTFSKIKEFMDFFEKLDKSFQKSVVQLEIKLNMVMTVKSCDDMEELIKNTFFDVNEATFYESRSDNRDFLRMCEWSGSVSIEKLTSCTRKDVNWLKYWHKCFNLLHETVETVEGEDSFMKCVNDLSFAAKQDPKNNDTLILDLRFWNHENMDFSINFVLFENLSTFVIKCTIIIFLIDKSTKNCRKNKDFQNKVLEYKKILKLRLTEFEEKVESVKFPEISSFPYVAHVEENFKKSVLNKINHSWECSLGHYSERLKLLIQMIK